MAKWNNIVLDLAENESSYDHIKLKQAIKIISS